MQQPGLFQPPSLSVADLTRYLRALLESDEILQDVWVLGEISNLSRPVSGHIYFTLKDSTAALRCVIWKSNALRLRTALQNGLAVEAHGYVSLYERDGNYQLYIDTLRPAGEGYLYQEFLRLKNRLEAEGLFDEERKRVIPACPTRIGIVTSPTGAALQDMLNTLRQRYPLAEVFLAPAAVQGEEAPPAIVAALDLLNRKIQPDVILVARGGGSLEDLWAFNDERVVRAIAASSTPVITGIGHETDFTLSDFAADRRAPTPTGAAVMATPNKADLSAGLDQLASRLNGAIAGVLYIQKNQVSEMQRRILRASPLWKMQNERQRLDDTVERLTRCQIHSLELKRARLSGHANRLAALSPLEVIRRGYAVVRGADGHLVRSSTQVNCGDLLALQLAEGSLETRVEKIHPPS
jgi:exodeoxyribonuclease VII large subunit